MIWGHVVNWRLRAWENLFTLALAPNVWNLHDIVQLSEKEYFSDLHNLTLTCGSAGSFTNGWFPGVVVEKTLTEAGSCPMLETVSWYRPAWAGSRWNVNTVWPPLWTKPCLGWKGRKISKMVRGAILVLGWGCVLRPSFLAIFVAMGDCDGDRDAPANVLLCCSTFSLEPGQTNSCVCVVIFRFRWKAWFVDVNERCRRELLEMNAVYRYCPRHTTTAWE